MVGQMTIIYEHLPGKTRKGNGSLVGGRGPSTTFLVVNGINVTDPIWQFVCNKLEKMSIKPPAVLTSNFANQVVTKKCA